MEEVRKRHNLRIGATRVLVIRYTQAAMALIPILGVATNDDRYFVRFDGFHITKDAAAHGIVAT
jgi:hypothetical protein